MYKRKFTDELDPTHFHCVRYIGPPLPAEIFDKTAIYYKFEDENGLPVTVMPLAFTWKTDEEPYLILPLWMSKMDNFEMLKFTKIPANTTEIFEGTLRLEWFANLRPANATFPWEEVLPHIFGESRPLCNGTVLPFIFGGQRYLLKVTAEGIEDGKLFWFNLETGSLDINGERRKTSTCSSAFEILIEGSWRDAFKGLKYQIEQRMEEDKELFLVCGVPFPLQRDFIESLKVECDPIDIFIPEEHLQTAEDDEDQDSISDNNQLKFLLEVDTFAPNLMNEAVLKKLHAKKSIFMSSARSIETCPNLLQLEKSAHRFNFQVINIQMQCPSEFERLEILKRKCLLGNNVNAEAVDEAIIQFKWSLNSLNFVELLRVANIFAFRTDISIKDRLEYAINCVKTSETSEIIFSPSSLVNYPFFGYKKLKTELENLIKGPLLNPEAYERFGLPKSSGFLLHGPPGCGKTSLCLNILTSAPFNQIFTIFHIPSASQMLSKYFGETEANIRKLFAQARERKPSILFVDQIETLGRKRDGSSASAERYLSTLLNEMDGISGNDGVTILACANDIGMLDEALLRPGRLDRHFYLGPPDEADKAEIIKGYNSDTEIHVDSFKNYNSGADIKAAVKKYNKM